MAKLSSTHKQFIVRHLAQMCEVSEVKKKLDEVFGIDVSTSQIVYYSPETAQAANLSSKWINLFYETRRAYIQEASKVPLFHKAYRLNEMQENYDKAKKVGNIVLCQQILEQAAKEAGGIYERSIEVAPSEGGDFYQQINNIIMQKDG